MAERFFRNEPTPEQFGRSIHYTFVPTLVETQGAFKRFDIDFKGEIERRSNESDAEVFRILNLGCMTGLPLEELLHYLRSDIVRIQEGTRKRIEGIGFDRNPIPGYLPGFFFEDPEAWERQSERIADLRMILNMLTHKDPEKFGKMQLKPDEDVRKGQYQTRGRYMKAAGEALPLDDNSIDVGFSMDALGYTDDPLRVIEEVSRVLKPGGRFFWLISGLDDISVSPDFNRIVQETPGADDLFTIKKIKKFGRSSTCILQEGSEGAALQFGFEKSQETILYKIRRALKALAHEANVNMRNIEPGMLKRWIIPQNMQIIEAAFHGVDLTVPRGGRLMYEHKAWPVYKRKGGFKGHYLSKFESIFHAPFSRNAGIVWRRDALIKADSDNP